MNPNEPITSVSNPKIVWTIISVVVLVLIVIAGYFVIAGKNTAESTISTTSNTASSSLETKKEWLVYTDPDKSFSIKYPSDWTVLGTQTDPSGINKLTPFVSPGIAGAVKETVGVLIADLKDAPAGIKSLEVYSEGNYASLKSSTNISNLSKLEDTTFAGLPAKKVSYVQANQDGDLVIEAVWTMSKDKVFGTSYVSSKVSKQRYSSVVKEMVSSLQILK